MAHVELSLTPKLLASRATQASTSLGPWRGKEESQETLNSRSLLYTNSDNESKPVKRKVAISVAYVGTKYRGSQINRLSAPMQSKHAP